MPGPRGNSEVRRGFHVEIPRIRGPQVALPAGAGSPQARDRHQVRMVGARGFEPPTSATPSRCSVGQREGANLSREQDFRRLWAVAAIRKHSHLFAACRTRRHLFAREVWKFHTRRGGAPGLRELLFPAVLTSLAGPKRGVAIASLAGMPRPGPRIRGRRWRTLVIGQGSCSPRTVAQQDRWDSLVAGCGTVSGGAVAGFSGRTARQ